MKKSSSQSSPMSIKEWPWKLIGGSVATLLAGLSGGYMVAPKSSNVEAPASLECKSTKVVVPVSVFVDGKKVAPK